MKRCEPFPVLGVLCLWLGLTLNVPQLSAAEPARFLSRLQTGEKISITTLGTSLTGGQWRWPDVMMEWLNHDFPGQVTLHNLGVGASASSHPPGRSGLDRARAAATLKPDVVFIEFAVNDAYLPYGISVAQSKSNLVSMIATLQAARPDVEIVLQTMNCVMDQPVGGAHATNRRDLASYCEGYQQVARDLGLRLVDHYPVWKRVMDADLPRFDRLVPDRIHPSLEGYREVLLPTLRQALMGTGAPPTAKEEGTSRL